MVETPHRRDERRSWLDDPSNVTRIVWTLVAVCVLLFLADFFYHKHGVFAVEHVFGFYALFGFVVYVALISLAKRLRAVVMRPEDYYDRDYRARDSTPPQD